MPAPRLQFSFFWLQIAGSKGCVRLFWLAFPIKHGLSGLVKDAAQRRCNVWRVRIAIITLSTPPQHPSYQLISLYPMQKAWGSKIALRRPLFPLPPTPDTCIDTLSLRSIPIGLAVDHHQSHHHHHHQRQRQRPTLHRNEQKQEEKQEKDLLLPPSRKRAIPWQSNGFMGHVAQSSGAPSLLPPPPPPPHPPPFRHHYPLFLTHPPFFYRRRENMWIFQHISASFTRSTHEI